MNDALVIWALPTSAHTGYGYIKADGDVVAQFVEKPDRTTAGHYFKEVLLLECRHFRDQSLGLVGGFGSVSP